MCAATVPAAGWTLRSMRGSEPRRRAPARIRRAAGRASYSKTARPLARLARLASGRRSWRRRCSATPASGPGRRRAARRWPVSRPRGRTTAPRPSTTGSPEPGTATPPGTAGRQAGTAGPPKPTAPSHRRQHPRIREGNRQLRRPHPGEGGSPAGRYTGPGPPSSVNSCTRTVRRDRRQPGAHQAVPGPAAGGRQDRPCDGPDVPGLHLRCTCAGQRPDMPGRERPATARQEGPRPAGAQVHGQTARWRARRRCAPPSYPRPAGTPVRARPAARGASR
jgi:hypothetical protein